MTNTPTHVAAGPVHSPTPMNPASKVWPVLNPNVVTIETGAWAHRELTPHDVDALDLLDRWRANLSEGW